MAEAEDAVTLTIAALGHEGDGIAGIGDRRVFVPFALPGEVVTTRIANGRGVLLEVVRRSADRADPVCAHFGVCGGCSLQHFAAKAYLDWKREQVVAAFAQRGIAAPVAPAIAVPPHSRRRVTFAAVNAKGGTILGFSRRGSHEIVPVRMCPVAVPAIAGRLDLFAAIAGTILPRGAGGRLTVVAADNGLDIAMDTGRRTGRGSAPLPAGIAGDPAIARLTVDGDTMVQDRRPEVTAGGPTLLPVPGGFLQASAEAEVAIAAVAVGAVGDAGLVADLFAGIGTLSLRLAQRSPVMAADGDATLLAALDEAARRSPGLKPVTTRRRDLFRNPLAPAELNAFGAVVFDPPRAGARAQAEALAQSAVPIVVAVSCNPATLARDARILIDGGYRLTGVTPIDQFLWSSHVEAVAVFAR